MSTYEALQRIQKSSLVGTCCPSWDVSGVDQVPATASAGYWQLVGGVPVGVPLLIQWTGLNPATVIVGESYRELPGAPYVFTSLTTPGATATFTVSWQQRCPTCGSLFPDA